MDAQEFRGKAVVALDSAKKVGRVSDVLFRTDPLRVTGLRVATEAGDGLLPFDGVASVGPDAVTVESDQTVQRASMATSEALPGLTQLVKLKVVDESGTYKGTVRSLEVDPADGVVTGLAVDSGGILGVGGDLSEMPVSVVRSVGPEVVTIRGAG